MIEFKCGEATSFEFEMQISGDLNGSPAASFSILAKDVSLVFKATQKGTGVWGVSVPNLERMLDPGTYPCEITVILADRIFTPIKDSCVLKSDPKPIVSGIKTVTQTAQPQVTVSFSKSTDQTQDPFSVEACSSPIEKVTPAVEEKAPSLNSADQSLVDMLLRKRKA
jgi:hypothetical protein